jgi:hypothetical protein
MLAVRGTAIGHGYVENDQWVGFEPEYEALLFYPASPMPRKLSREEGNARPLPGRSIQSCTFVHLCTLSTKNDKPTNR